MNWFGKKKTETVEREYVGRHRTPDGELATSQRVAEEISGRKVSEGVAEDILTAWKADYDKKVKFPPVVPGKDGASTPEKAVGSASVPTPTPRRTDYIAPVDTSAAMQRDMRWADKGVFPSRFAAVDIPSHMW